MKYIPVDKIERGMRLAMDLCGSEGNYYALAGEEIGEVLKHHLTTNCYRGVYVSDTISVSIKVNTIVEPKVRRVMMQAIKELDVPELEKSAKTILREIRNSGEMVLDYLDPRAEGDYTYAHSVNVAIISGIIGIRLMMPLKEVEELILTALLHDVGMRNLPLEVAIKSERFTQEDYITMKMHPTHSHKIVKDLNAFSDKVLQGVLHHHENVDGSGYPSCIMNEEIPLYSKIIRVADAYDGLIAKRPYKSPYSPIEAAEFLLGGCGIFFDRKMVEALLKSIPVYPIGTEVKLSDGNRAYVYKNQGENKARPFVLTKAGEFINLARPPHLSLQLESELEHADFNTRAAEEERNAMIKGKIHYRIMAVDDQKTNLSLLKEILEDYYELTLLKSGEQAIRYIDGNTCPDLILMDINMPGMDGIETAKRLQSLTGNLVPIIFVSSNNDLQTVLACRDLNCAGYVVRPYNAVFLKSEIKRILTGEI